MLVEKINLRSEKNSLADLAYQHILRAILSHQLKAGDRLRPENLAEVLGVSPTPIKEALARLSGEGLVQFRSGQGSFVAVPAEEDLLDLYDCRLMCELHAVHEGIEKADTAFLASAAELLRQWQEAYVEADEAKQMHYDGEFHQHIVSLWPNRRMTSWYQQLNWHTRGLRLREFFGLIATPNRLAETGAEHAVIYEALRQRDSRAAAAAIRQHIESSRNSIMATHRARIAR